VAVLAILAVACVFTVAGGLTAVIWTDTVQIVLMVAGAFVLTFKGSVFSQPLLYQKVITKKLLLFFTYFYSNHITSLFLAFSAAGGYEKMLDDFFHATATNRSLKIPGDESSGNEKAYLASTSLIN